MFKARRMLPREYASDTAFTARNAAGEPLNSCVEHESGKTITSLSWTEAVEEARRMNEEAAAGQVNGLVYADPLNPWHAHA